MKHFRFTSLIFLILSCVILFVGCGQDQPTESESTRDTTIAQPKETVTTTAPSTTVETITVAPETTEPPVEVVKSDFEIYQSNSITPSSCNYALKSADEKPVR